MTYLDPQAGGGVTITPSTFTPTLQDVTFSDAEGQTYFIQIGRAYQIEDWVHFSLEISINSIGTLTGVQNAYISLGSLPNEGGGVDYPVAIGESTGLGLTGADITVTGAVEAGTNRIILRQWAPATGTSGLTIGEVTASSSFVISGAYRTA